MEGIQDLHGLDVFSGRHGRTAAAMQKCAFRSVVYDICHGGLKHDITSVEGFETLMLLALRLLPFALVMLGPPCSMFVYMSSSQHLRHLFGPSGHPRDVATQLGNRIANNTVPRDVLMVVWCCMVKVFEYFDYFWYFQYAVFSQIIIIIINLFSVLWGFYFEYL